QPCVVGPAGASIPRGARRPRRAHDRGRLRPARARRADASHARGPRHPGLPAGLRPARSPARDALHRRPLRASGRCARGCRGGRLDGRARAPPHRRPLGPAAGAARRGPRRPPGDPGRAHDLVPTRRPAHHDAPGGRRRPPRHLPRPHAPGDPRDADPAADRRVGRPPPRGARVTPVVAVWQTEGVWRRCSDYLALTKPRVVAMILVTTAVGFHLGSAASPLFLPLLYTLAGTALAAGGTLALNQYMERDLDARMDRTRHRPLPEGRVHPGEALVLGYVLLVGGVGVLALAIEPLAAIVTAAIAITYLFVYTPLKRVSSLCSLVGAIPGALPPVAGWAAARGTLGPEPWILFAIMFLWQVPHTLAIGRLYRDDYARAGIRMLPVADRDGRR